MKADFDAEVLRLRVERASRKYEIGMTLGAGCRRLDRSVQDQAESYREAAVRTEMRALQVRNILNARGVSAPMYLWYRNFALHIDKLIRAHEGETLNTLVLLAINRWVAYGCELAILLRVCREVFELPPTTPAP